MAKFMNDVWFYLEIDNSISLIKSNGLAEHTPGFYSELQWQHSEEI